MTDDEGSGEDSTGGALTPIRRVLSALGRAFGGPSTWSATQRTCPECGDTIVIDYAPGDAMYCPDCRMEDVVDSPTRNA